MGAGKRRQIRKQICNMLYDFTKMDLPMYPEGWQDIAGQIMKLFPKPEVTIIHRKETEIFKIPYYTCGKCGGIIEREECSAGITHYKFCPICGRRIMAWEDDTLWQ